MSKTRPTKQVYEEIQTAFDYFNQELFDGKLPACLITLQRKSRTRGYFSAERFVSRDGHKVDEIAMNPEFFAINSVEETLSTLVHEMVHLFQHHFGKPSRRRYHNEEWAEHMDKIGLGPSLTGEPRGNRTGEKVSHYIRPGGDFDRACEELLTNEYRLSWMDRFPPPYAVERIKEKAKGAPPSSPPLLRPAATNSLEDVENLRFATETEEPAAPVDAGTQSTVETSIAAMPDSPSINRDKLEQARAFGVEVDAPPQASDRTNRWKYSCPKCDANVWGKPNLKLVCGSCSDEETIVAFAKADWRPQNSYLIP